MNRYCPKCGNMNNDEAVFCNKCGTEINAMPQELQSNLHNIPQDIKSWNMGAFMQTAIWGIANEVYEALWVFVVIIPIIGWIAALAIMIWMGISGNELAYKKKHYDTINDFKQAQNTWNRAGWITFILSMLSGFIYFIVFIIMGIAETGLNF